MDFIIVPLSLIVEISFNGLGGFFVFVRLWRMARILTKVTTSKLRKVSLALAAEEEKLSRVQVQNNIARPQIGI